MAALAFLPLGALIQGAWAVTIEEYDFDTLANGGLAFREQNLSLGEMSHNGSFDFRLPAGAVILNASMQLTGYERYANISLAAAGGLNAPSLGYGAALDARADFNADGEPDLAVGATGNYAGGQGGLVDVYYGGPGRGPAAGPGWTFLGNNTTSLGGALAHGDYNRDGVDDLAVANPASFACATAAEQVLLFYGSPTGLQSSPDLVLERPGPNATRFGSQLAGGLDLDGDTYDDLVVGEQNFFEWLSPGCPPLNNCTRLNGRVVILWGGPGGLSTANLTYLTRENVSTFPAKLTPIGDGDLDGADELAIYSGWTNRDRGMVSIYQATPGNRSPLLVWSKNGTRDYQEFGLSILGGRDLDNDSINDLLVGTGGYGQGQIDLHAGLGNGSYAPAPSQWIEDPPNSAYYARAMDFVGDPEVDGREALLVSEFYVSNYYSRLWSYPLPGLANASDSIIRGTTWAGTIVKGLGDMDADGIDDFAVTSLSYPPGGAVLVYFGSSTRFPQNVTLTVGGTPVWTRAGELRGRADLPDLSAAAQAYLDAHAMEAAPDGTVGVPFDIGFSVGGRVTVEAVHFAYTLLSPPQNVSAAALPGRGAIAVSWDSSAQSDLSAFWLWTNRSGTWEQVIEVGPQEGSAADFGVGFAQVGCYRVTAVDLASGVQSAPSAVACAQTEDPWPPPVPAGLAAAPDEAASAIMVTWGAPSHLAHTFEVWRSTVPESPGDLLATVSPAGMGYDDANVTRGVTYEYRLRAFSDGGASSSYTAPAPARLRMGAGPAAPANLVASPDAGGHALTLSWAESDPMATSFIVHYSLEGSGGNVTRAPPTAATTLELSGLPPDQNLSLWVVAVNADGLPSTPSDVLVVRLVDTVAPRPPRGLAATSPPEGGALALRWTASPDLDVAKYRIYLIGPEATATFELALEVDASATSARLVGLQDHLTYILQMTAVDGAENESPGGEVAFGTPERVGPPATPSLDPLPRATNLRTINVTGTCTLGLWAQVFLDGSLAAQAPCAADGRFEAPIDLLEGTHSLAARQRDPDSDTRASWAFSAMSAEATVHMDATPPRVVSATPSEGDIVAPASRVAVRFSEAVDPPSIRFALEVAGGPAVEGSFTYDAASETLLFTPAAPLPTSVDLIARVGANDTAGNPMAPFSFAFAAAPPGGGSPATTAQPSYAAAAFALSSFVAAASVFMAARLLRGGRSP